MKSAPVLQRGLALILYGRDMLLREVCLYVGKYGVNSKAEFLVKHLVGGRCTEMVEAEHLAVCSYDTAQG